MTQKVSIIVPAYNQAEYLPICLDSIYFQDYELIEIVIVDDGSSDSTAQVILDFQKLVKTEQVSFASFYDSSRDSIDRTSHYRYPQAGRILKIISKQVNQGLAAALNSGFKACSGDYCTYVPADDICYPSMISEMVDALESNNADFVFSDMFIVDDHGRILRRFSLPNYSFKTNFADWYLCGVSKLYKKSLHEMFGYYDENLLAHDHELFQRFAIQGAKFHHIPKVLMGVRDHEQHRQVEIHDPKNWNRLLNESKELVLEARSWKTK